MHGLQVGAKDVLQQSAAEPCLGKENVTLSGQQSFRTKNI